MDFIGRVKIVLLLFLWIVFFLYGPFSNQPFNFTCWYQLEGSRPRCTSSRLYIVHLLGSEWIITLVRRSSLVVTYVRTLIAS